MTNYRDYPLRMSKMNTPNASTACTTIYVSTDKDEEDGKYLWDIKVKDITVACLSYHHPTQTMEILTDGFISLPLMKRVNEVTALLIEERLPQIP